MYPYYGSFSGYYPRPRYPRYAAFSNSNDVRIGVGRDEARINPWVAGAGALGAGYYARKRIKGDYGKSIMEARLRNLLTGTGIDDIEKMKSANKATQAYRLQQMK